MSFKNLVLIGYSMLLAHSVIAQSVGRYPVIPLPVKLMEQPGEFKITSAVKIVSEANDKMAQNAIDFFQNYLNQEYRLHIFKTTKARQGKTAIIFKKDNTITGDEGYTLVVKSTSITVGYKTPQGAFWAVQTLRQLMQKKGSLPYISIPAVVIEDHPRFGYRGFMLDVARHFFPYEFLKKYIDLLALYKINTFHLHLNDDQGWRMESRRYPKLHRVGAWRKQTLIGHRTDKPERYDNTPYGGYYTQKQLKELVQYAQQRFITIIPEIDVPGHAQALLAAYPQYGCIDSIYQVSEKWGVHNNILCPTEETFSFLENIFGEVMQIFPSKYIHIGGDEVPKDRWKESAFCQQLIKKMNLADEHELQSYFIRRVEKMLNAKGRTIIGWDEILDGGLAPNAVVMSWRGEKGGIAAARQKHPVIMSPNRFLYLDYYQTNEGRAREPLANSAKLPLQKVYEYNPVPAELSAEDAGYILGPQANLWTEYIATGSQAELMTFPRLCAFAELAWTPVGRKAYGEFMRRLLPAVHYLKSKGVNVAEYEWINK